MARTPIKTPWRIDKDGQAVFADEHLVEVIEFLADLMCNFADRDKEVKASMVGTAINVIERYRSSVNGWESQ